MEIQTSPLRGIPHIIFIYVFLAVVLWGGPYKVEGKRMSSSLHFIVANRNLSHPKRNMNSKESVRAVRYEGKENHSGPIFNESNLREELQHVKVSRNISEALHMATYEEMKRDKNVYVIGEDVGLYGGSYKVTKNLAHFFGFARVLDTPICENSFMGLGIGSAINGLRPIVEGMNLSFLIMAFNQISNNAGMLRYMTDGQFNIPLVIRGPGGVGKQLGPEHSQRIESYLMSIPGIKIVACSTPFNARGLLKSAIRDNNPVVFLEHVLLYNVTEEIPLLPYTLPIDKAEIVKKGTDLTILCYGINRHVALEASKELKKNNIDVEIVDLISLKPFDLETIKYSLQKTNKCLILDESAAYGGIGAELYTQIMENFSSYLKKKPVRLCTKDIPIPYSSPMEDACVVKKEDVVYMATYMHAN